MISPQTANHEGPPMRPQARYNSQAPILVSQEMRTKLDELSELEQKSLAQVVREFIEAGLDSALVDARAKG